METNTSYKGYQIETYDIGEESTEISLHISKENQAFCPENSYPSTTYENHTQAASTAINSINNNSLNPIECHNLSQT